MKKLIKKVFTSMVLAKKEIETEEMIIKFPFSFTDESDELILSPFN